LEILVINLMRLGDLVQTSPVLRRLHAEYPESRVSLLVMDLFPETARLLPGVDRLLIFPSAALAALLDQEYGWPEAARQLAQWLAESFQQPPDLVVNLTPNRLGSILAFASGAPEIRGMAVDRSWGLATRPAWASYALIVSKTRLANPFNLVDLFLREAGLTPDGQGLEVAVPPEAAREAGKVLADLKLTPDTALVGLLPGASKPERCWPPAQFARVAALLLEKRPCHFLIFGSAREAPLGEAIAQRLPASAITLFLGKTSPPVLAAFLKRLDLLITNDTGPMHLAAAVGTPTVALFLASARVQDTGPVGEGHVILEPQLHCHPCLAPCPQPLCHQAISPEVVTFWAEKLLNHEPLITVEDIPFWSTTRIYQATTDPLGYQIYLPLVRRPLDRRSFWLWLHRLVWGQGLDIPQLPAAPLRQWLFHLLSTYFLPPRGDLSIAAGRDCLSELVQTAARGEELAQEIAFLAEEGQEFPVRLWQKSEALEGVDRSLRRLGVAFPELSAAIEFFFQEQRGKPGTEIIPLAGELQQAYARLKRLGQLGLEGLGELSAILESEDRSGTIPGLAQAVQNGVTKKGPKQPESEGAPCR